MQLLKKKKKKAEDKIKSLLKKMQISTSDIFRVSKINKTLGHNINEGYRGSIEVILYHSKIIDIIVINQVQNQYKNWQFVSA